MSDTPEFNWPDWAILAQDGKRVAYYPSGVRGVGRRKFAGVARYPGGPSAFVRDLVRQHKANVELGVPADADWHWLCEQWVTANEGVLKEGTFRARVSAINNWIAVDETDPRLAGRGVGRVLLGDTNLSTLTTVLSAMVTGPEPERRAVATIGNVRDTMFVIAEWARSEGRTYLSPDPFGTRSDQKRPLREIFAKAKRTGQKRDSGDPDKDRHITLAHVPKWEQVVELSEAWADHVGGLAGSRKIGELYGAALRVTAGSGLRTCEELGLTVPQVNLDTLSIYVGHQIDRYVKWEPGEPMPTTLPKHDRTRHVAVWEKVEEDLTLLMDAAADRGDAVLLRPLPGVTWQTDWYERHLLTVRTKIGWGWPNHYLRHHYGSYTLAPIDKGGRGRLPVEVQEWMGHASLQTTLETYVHKLSADRVGRI